MIYKENYKNTKMSKNKLKFSLFIQIGLFKSKEWYKRSYKFKE